MDNNVILGDNTGVDLPTLQPDEDSLVEEKKMARYSKTKEFARIKEHFEAKTAYYQQFLPGNIPVEAVSEEERGRYWAIANVVIREFNEVINMFEVAKDVVETAEKEK